MSQVDEKLVAMQNGCICCTLREDLLIEVSRLAAENKFDYLVIESTGISEPLPVAETFTFDIQIEGDDSLRPLCEIATLDTMVTVVDAQTFLSDITSIQDYMERFPTEEVENNTSIATLLIEQVEFANVLLLNKIDLVSDEDLLKVEGILRKLNPRAEILKTNYSKVDMKHIIGTKKFDFDEAQQFPGWLQELRGEHTPETEEYGITSFVYRRTKPFHAQRLHDLLIQGIKTVVRTKGTVWLAPMNDMTIEWSGTGEVISLGSGGPWLCLVEDEVCFTDCIEVIKRSI